MQTQETYLSILYDKETGYHGKSQKHDCDVKKLSGQEESTCFRFFNAIESECSPKELSLLLNEIKDINVFRESDGKTALHLAVSKNKRQLCKLLIDKRANVNNFTFVQKVKETPLHMACTPLINVDILELLLENGADVTLRSTDKSIMPLHNVLDMHGLTENDVTESQYCKLKLLVKWKADVNALSNGQENSVEILFHKNFFCNSSEIPKAFVLKALEFILRNGFDVNKKGKPLRTNDISLTGSYPFHLAIAMHPYCMELLIQSGADLSTKFMGRETAMTSIVDYGNVNNGINWKEVLEYIKMLIKNGISVNSINTFGNSLLHKLFAPWYTKNKIDCIPIHELLSLGADLNLKNICGETPLLTLSESRENFLSRTWKNLLKQTDVNARDYNGRTLLMRVMKFGNPEIVKVLIEQKAQVNARDKCGRTALHHLILARRYTRYFQKENFSKKIHCGENKRIIYEEVIEFEQKLFIIGMLVKEKIECEIKDNFNKTAFQYIEEEEDKLYTEEYPEDLEWMPTNRIYSVVDKHLVKHHTNNVFNSFKAMENKLTSEWQTWNCIDTAVNVDINMLEDLVSTPGIGFVNCTYELKRVGEQVYTAMCNLTAKICSNNLTFDIQLSGSVSEGTKVGFPDEYDYLMFIGGLDQLFTISEIGEKPGFGTMRLKDNNLFPEFCKAFVDQEGYFLGNMFKRHFHNLVCKALLDGEVFQDTSLYYCQGTFSEESKAILLFKLKCPTDSFNDIELSIDLVPAIKLSTNWWPCYAKERSSKFLIGRSQGYCLLLTKHEDSIYLRISSSLLETEIINSLPGYMQKAYMLLKVLNNYFHFHLPDINTCNSPLVNPHLLEDDRPLLEYNILRDGLTSYHFKTTLLHVAYMEFETESKMIQGRKEIENIVAFANKILKQLMECVEKQMLPNFFFPSRSLFPPPVNRQECLKSILGMLKS